MGGKAMRKQTTVYECPICETDYLTLDEAEECLENCKDNFNVTTREVWGGCQACGKIFYTPEEQAKHLIVCQEQTCATCEHCDLEGRRSGPCRQYTFAPIIPACEEYEQAYK